ncbi:MAG: hypothetical protein HFE49_00415 [Clostridia bacterium]|nr:hypothetical protein [Clostridia bacterium]
MKIKDIETVNEVFECLKNGVEISPDLFDRFSVAVDNFNTAIAKQKQNYYENADTFRARSKQWRRDNAERKAAYQKEYMQRDYVKERNAGKSKKKKAHQDMER